MKKAWVSTSVSIGSAVGPGQEALGSVEGNYSSNTLSERGEGSREEDLARQRQKADWIRRTCPVELCGIIPLFTEQESWRYTI